MGALGKGKVALEHIMQLDEWANVILEPDQDMSLARVGSPPAGALAWRPIEGNARMEALLSWFGDQASCFHQDDCVVLFEALLFMVQDHAIEVGCCKATAWDVDRQCFQLFVFRKNPAN